MMVKRLTKPQRISSFAAGILGMATFALAATVQATGIALFLCFFASVLLAIAICALD